MDEMLSLRVECDNIQLALVPALVPLPDKNISPDEIPLIFVPFGDKLFEIVVCHFSFSFPDSSQRAKNNREVRYFALHQLDGAAGR